MGMGDQQKNKCRGQSLGWGSWGGGAVVASVPAQRPLAMEAACSAPRPFLQHLTQAAARRPLPAGRSGWAAGQGAWSGQVGDLAACASVRLLSRPDHGRTVGTLQTLTLQSLGGPRFGCLSWDAQGCSHCGQGLADVSA